MLLGAHSPISMSIQRVLFEIDSNPKQKLPIHDRLITIQTLRFGAKEFIVVMVWSPLSTGLQYLNSKEIFLHYKTEWQFNMKKLTNIEIIHSNSLTSCTVGKLFVEQKHWQIAHAVASIKLYSFIYDGA